MWDDEEDERNEPDIPDEDANPHASVESACGGICSYPPGRVERPSKGAPLERHAAAEKAQLRRTKQETIGPAVLLPSLPVARVLAANKLIKVVERGYQHANKRNQQYRSDDTQRVMHLTSSSSATAQESASGCAFRCAS